MRSPFWWPLAWSRWRHFGPSDGGQPVAVDQLSDRYAIERELGAGGMATVYLAEDVKLHRRVAVKGGDLVGDYRQEFPVGAGLLQSSPLSSYT